jgi:hypothetical protein
MNPDPNRVQTVFAAALERAAADRPVDRDAALQQARSDADAARKAETLTDGRKDLAELRDRIKTSDGHKQRVAVPGGMGRQQCDGRRPASGAVPPNLGGWHRHYLNRLHQGGLLLTGRAAETSNMLTWKCNRQTGIPKPSRSL